MAISLVPVNEIDKAFQIISKEEIHKEVNADKQAIQNILTYFTNTWLKKGYDRDLWNHSSTVGLRTNNHVNKILTSSHPNLFKFIDLIKGQEFKSDLKFNAILQGRGKKDTTSAKDEQIKTIKYMYKNKKLTLDQLLTSFSYLVGEN